MPQDTIAIKLAKILKIDVDSAEKLFQVLPSLSDVAELTTAINTDDFKKVNSIYNTHRDQLSFDNQSIIDSYTQQIETLDVDEALDNVAKEYGITIDQVQEIINSYLSEKDSQKEELNLDIPDKQVENAYYDIMNMINGHQSNGSVFEAKNPWQKRMLYGLISPAVAKVIQKTLDMTPLKVMQQHAILKGYGEPAIKESQLSLNQMLISILENNLKNINKKKPVKKEDMLLAPDHEEEEVNDELPDEQLPDAQKILIDSIAKKRF